MQYPITHTQTITNLQILALTFNLINTFRDCPGIVLLGNTIIKSRGYPSYINVSRIAQLAAHYINAHAGSISAPG